MINNPIPYRVEEKNEKFYRTTQGAYFFGLFHLLGFIGFMLIGVSELAWFNLFVSSPAFIAALILNRLGRHNKAFAFAFFEIFVHQVLAIYLMGWDLGFQYLLFYLAGLSFFNPNWKRAFHIFTLVLIGIAFILLYIFCQNGIYTLDSILVKVMFIAGALGSIIVLALLINSYSSAAHKAERELTKANKETRDLLLNILPETIADRLTNSSELIADRFEHTTILFSDLVGFTKLSSELNPGSIVAGLNEFFYAFDTIVEGFNLEKIKTIGDGYMVAGGVPNDNKKHAEDCILCAGQMIEYLNTFNENHGTDLQIRIGVHTGPVVAGVIGKNKFSYDIWGDTVNIASRMESHGKPGRVHISSTTQKEIDDRFTTVSRGQIDIKGKGLMETFFVQF